MDTNELMKEALAYHAEGGPGNEIRPTKPDATQYDLSLAYFARAAALCLAIADDPAKAYDYTIKGNLVAVITNGTAVLTGATSFAGRQTGHGGQMHAFQALLRNQSPSTSRSIRSIREEFIAAVKRIAPPRRDQSRRHKSSRMFRDRTAARRGADIPVMHDDQHERRSSARQRSSTRCTLSGKRIDGAQIVVNGAGAAAIAPSKDGSQLGERAPRPDHDATAGA